MKQYLLHYGYPGRLSTGGNVAFPFTPPEVSLGTAYRFNVHHIGSAGHLGTGGAARSATLNPGCAALPPGLVCVA